VSNITIYCDLCYDAQKDEPNHGERLRRCEKAPNHIEGPFPPPFDKHRYLDLCPMHAQLRGDLMAIGKANAEEKEKKRQASIAEAEAEEKERITELLECGETIYRCGSCDHLWPEGELIQIRQCSNANCETVFNGTDNGRNCTECNRPFSRILHAKGCPDCEEEDECSEVDLYTVADTSNTE
jgi:hypothetical protein